MKKLFRAELWRMLLCFCLLTAAAAYLRPRLSGAALPLWVCAALAVWCLLLGLSRRAGAWGPAVLCLIALSVCLLPIARTEREALPDLAALIAHPAFLPCVLALASLALSYAPDSFSLRAGAALVWLGLWLAAAILVWKLPRLTVTAMLPLPLFALCEACFRLRRRGGEADFAPLRSGLCLVLVLAALLTALAPAPADPYDYPVLRAVVRRSGELWRDLESRLSRRSEGEMQFGLRFDGMAETPETGDTGGEGGRSRLYLQPYAATDGPLYLIGNAWDRFDGRSWSQSALTVDEKLLRWHMDTMEHVYALWRWQQGHGKKDDERFFRANHVFVSYGDLETRTMFGAMNALHFYSEGDRYSYAAGAGGLLFDHMQRSETAYRIYWLEANARTLDQLIAFSDGYVYDEAVPTDWDTLMERYETRFHLDFQEEEPLEALLSRRQALIRARDLDTNGVSERAAALAAEITADCRTDYEKLKAIAAYLQENYDYTISPTPVPEGENFLDWLLFETGEGYCTWYATAAALLGRSVGVPTRYVQGYRAGALPTRRFTTVEAEAAHAWCEGYVAGYGWVTVEATPGFSAVGYGWTTPEEQGRAALAEEETIEPERAHGGKQSVLTDGADGGRLPGKAEGAPAPEAEEEAERAPRLRWLLLLPPALALLLLAFRLLRIRRRRRRYLTSPPEEQVRQDLGRLLGYLRRRGYPRAPEESLSACFGSISWRYLPAEREEALKMAAFFERVLFGGCVPGPEELETERAFVERFRPTRARPLLRARQWLRSLR